MQNCQARTWTFESSNITYSCVCHRWAWARAWAPLAAQWEVVSIQLREIASTPLEGAFFEHEILQVHPQTTRIWCMWISMSMPTPQERVFSSAARAKRHFLFTCVHERCFQQSNWHVKSSGNTQSSCRNQGEKCRQWYSRRREAKARDSLVCGDVQVRWSDRRVGQVCDLSSEPAWQDHWKVLYEKVLKVVSFKRLTTFAKKIQ